MRAIIGSKQNAVTEIGPGIGHRQIDRLLRARNHNRTTVVLNQIGEGRSSVGKGICSVTHHESVIVIVGFFDAFYDLQPDIRPYIGTVDVKQLDGFHVADLLYFRDKFQKFV